MTVIEYRQRVTRMTAQLRRVNEALSRWYEIDCQRLVPREFRRRIRRPLLSHEALKELQAMLVAELGDLDIAFQRGSPLSLN